MAKSKPTEHQLDLHRILKAKAKPGHLALFGRDGYFSYQAADIENHKPSSSVHLFHYDSGGVVRADQSTDGTIIVSNNKGSLQVFQPKESSRRPSVSICNSLSPSFSMLLFLGISKVPKSTGSSQAPVSFSVGSIHCQADGASRLGSRPDLHCHKLG